MKLHRCQRTSVSRPNLAALPTTWFRSPTTYAPALEVLARKKRAKFGTASVDHRRHGACSVASNMKTRRTGWIVLCSLIAQGLGGCGGKLTTAEATGTESRPDAAEGARDAGTPQIDAMSTPPKPSEPTTSPEAQPIAPAPDGAGACLAIFQPCTDGAECCSAICEAGVCKGLPANCQPKTAPCKDNQECCSKICDPRCGVCLGTPSLCGQTGDLCSLTIDCCSGSCNRAADASTGICDAPHVFTCVPNNQPCTASAQCCSGYCDGCQCTGAPSCVPVGNPCKAHSDCCSLLCNVVADASSGTCVQPGPAMCVSDDQPCLNNGACCSGNCVSGVCRGLPIECKSVGNSCKSSVECCSNLCDPQCGVCVGAAGSCVQTPDF
jgi:hypothetical protein